MNQIQTHPNAEKLLALEAPAMLVERFSKEHNTTPEETQKRFTETMKFLIVCAMGNGPFAPSPVIDEMWHSLIQFTPLYTRICVALGKSYIHHNPTTTSEVQSYQRTLQVAATIFGDMDPAYWNKAGCCNYCSEFDCDNGSAIPSGPSAPSYLAGFNALFPSGSLEPRVIQ